MCFSMQSFLSVRNELEAEKEVPEEVLQTLKARGWPPLAQSTKVLPTEASAQHGETFLLTFASAPPANLAPVSAGGDATKAVLQILGPELGASPLFVPEAPASAMLVRRAIGGAAAAGQPTPRLWLAGEIARRGALRRLPFVILERVLPPTPPPLATSLCALPAEIPGLSSGLPRFDDAYVFLAELRRIALGAGATELDAPLARLVASCKDKWKLEPTTPQIMLHREALTPLPTPEGAAKPEDVSPADADAAVGSGSYSPWASIAVGDPRLLDGDGEPWDLIRAFGHVVKVRWLIDVLRRQPGTAPRCQLSELLAAHDASQAMLASRGWLPATIVAPGSSSAKLAETFPEEMCPNY